MELKVTCIIPAWNEASRLPRVLAAVVEHPFVDEVLVVDDGSSDGTADVARHGGAKVLSLRPNRGKAAAVAAGLRQATGDVVLLIDADLDGLTLRHVTELLLPLRTGLADVSISLRSNAPLPWRLIGLDYISGERAMRMATLRPHLEAMGGLRGFGLEVFLNRLWLGERQRIAIVPLAGVASPSKLAKRGWVRGAVDDVRMLRDIFRTVGLGTVLGQIIGMRSARIR